MSIPGQTMGAAVFTDEFVEAFGLSRTQLSIAYLFGTVGSALFLTPAGRLYDRFGARLTLVAASLGLGIFVLWLSVLDTLATGLAAFPLVFLGYFGVRFSGQGVLASASRNVLLVWFESKRGWVSGIRGVFVSLGFSLAPIPLGFLIGELGWRMTLWILGGVVAVGFGLASLLLVRDNPESCGLEPDGGSVDGNEGGAPNAPDRTLSEARSSPVFWVHSLSLSIHALFGTAVTFHIAAIFNEAGRSREEAFAYFFPMALVSTSVNLLSSWLSDRAPLKPFLVVMLLAFICGATGLIHLERDWGYWLLVAGFGAGGGLWGLLSNLSFVRFFGRLHLGEISGLNTAITVFASAIGPALFSLGADGFGTYRAAAWLCLGGLVGLLVAAVVIPQREPSSG
ncbi:MFS transporter [Myxococcota bacterium]|nr:MFS transporter [Myxococcota bacterium]